MRCCVVFCFLFVCIVFACADGLKASDKGVCVSKQTTVKTRPKTVLVALSKWCGKKKCTVRQTRQQKYTVVTNRLMCCKGFVYAAATDSCAPVCSTGCANGTCVDPDVCHCASPLYLDPTTKNKCLTPSCDHPCINSQCTVNNTCTCTEGFVVFNSTHCAPNCTEGFELNSSMTCAPMCLNCTNGSCVSPDVCECDPGYSLVNETCQPVCKTPCVNGWCSAPDVCSCDEEFTRKSATECQRSCAGECRANGTCLVMATKPKTRQTTYEAAVPCGRGKKCPKTLTKTEKYMEKVPVEICCDSYDYDVGTDQCVPVCENECEGGKCVAPNMCICEPPLVFNNDTIPNKCVPPVCDNPCINGVCTANNQCTCSDGYALREDNFTCAAQCTNCTNGDCVSPDVCECYKGYAMKNDQCTPECKNDCSHGVCSAPDICSCDDGYKLKDKHCEPTCAENCVNGYCSGPNQCSCKYGYTQNATNPSICYVPCVCNGGTCNLEGECKCEDDMTLLNGTCVLTTPESSGITATTTTGLASLQMTWWVAGAVGLLLVVLVLVSISRIWHTRKDFPQKAANNGPLGSVAYTLPNTLVRDDNPDEADEEPSDNLLDRGTSAV